MKVGICSLGCKVNIYESELVTNILKNNNYEIVDFEDKADIYIINTCSVTNESDKKSRKMINRAKKNNLRDYSSYGAATVRSMLKILMLILFLVIKISQE